MKLPSWSKQEAIDYLGFTIAKENDWDFDEGDAHAVWLIAEGARIRRLDALS